MYSEKCQSGLVRSGEHAEREGIHSGGRTFLNGHLATGLCKDISTRAILTGVGSFFIIFFTDYYYGFIDLGRGGITVKGQKNLSSKISRPPPWGTFDTMSYLMLLYSLAFICRCKL